MQYPTNDLSNHWLPFTANKAFKRDPRLMESARGVYYKTPDGHQILDGVSGLFCSPAGHGRSEIAEAVYQQLLTLSYATSFQHSHPASFELARRLSLLTPGDLDYMFFAGSGSEAVETAMKIAITYHRARGEAQRQRFVGRERAYHGVNYGGMSLGGMVRNRASFGLGMPGVVHLRHTWLDENRFSRGQPARGRELAEDLQRLCELHGGDTIAACVVEPVAGSTGCLPPPEGYLERLREICDQHGILLVFDEVITGFGRMGSNFGAQRFGVTPDIMTMAKALTNGAFPMGAVAVSEKVYSTVVNAGGEEAIEFYHGYTYSAHPAACAASLATLDIYETENLFQRSAEMEDYFLDAVFSLKDMPAVSDVRGIGLFATIDIDPKGAAGSRAMPLIKAFFEAGLLVKMTGDSILLSPPFVSERKHIDEMRDKLEAVIARC